MERKLYGLRGGQWADNDGALVIVIICSVGIVDEGLCAIAVWAFDKPDFIIRSSAWARLDHWIVFAAAGQVARRPRLAAFDGTCRQRWHIWRHFEVGSCARRATPRRSEAMAAFACLPRLANLCSCRAPQDLILARYKNRGICLVA